LIETLQNVLSDLIAKASTDRGAFEQSAFDSAHESVDTNSVRTLQRTLSACVRYYRHKYSL